MLLVLLTNIVGINWLLQFSLIISFFAVKSTWIGWIMIPQLNRLNHDSKWNKFSQFLEYISMLWQLDRAISRGDQSVFEVINFMHKKKIKQIKKKTQLGPLLFSLGHGPTIFGLQPTAHRSPTSLLSPSYFPRG